MSVVGDDVVPGCPVAVRLLFFFPLSLTYTLLYAFFSFFSLNFVAAFFCMYFVLLVSLPC